MITKDPNHYRNLDDDERRMQEIEAQGDREQSAREAQGYANGPLSPDWPIVGLVTFADGTHYDSHLQGMVPRGWSPKKET